ncbi:glycosyltransferase family 2 protein [Rhodoflexus caldus]|uniref:glycosyltransferase family 2 protein n=1 Tax=Rhodoflexus caldus TaxID=2891236 RepID=UPI00202A06BE|nr:glycosyltransferase family 2 protein [Rhodoflexus caldus]
MQAEKPLISIVSPVYKAEKIVDLLVRRVSSEVSKITTSYEIILVEDGSPDASWEAIEQNCLQDKRVKGIKLSRNFGQHYAITAGLDHAQGEWIVVMDCDLQDRPEEIINLYQKALGGYDIVLARRHERQDNFLKRFFSWSFYQVLSYLTGTKHDPAVANFGIYHRKVIQAVCQMRESIRVFPIMVRWTGFKTAKLDVIHSEREIGKTTYNFKRLLNLALDIMLAYSDKPIRLTIKLGLTISIIAFLFALFLLFEYVSGIITVPGYTSIIISIWFLSGLIIMTLGIVGLYVGKIFEGVRNRPIYIINTKLN